MLRKKINLLPDAPAETVYGPEDYATPGAVERLFELGHSSQAMDVLDEYGEFLGDYSTMDPMDIMIALEDSDDTDS